MDSLQLFNVVPPQKKLNTFVIGMVQSVVHTLLRKAADTVETASFPRPPPVSFQPKNILPELVSYREDPGDEYWIHFPNFFPTSPQTKINFRMIPKLADEARFGNKDIVKWLVEGFTEGFRVGASLAARTSVETSNAKSAAVSGVRTSDAVASWVQKGYVSGPYTTLPLENFRINSLLAIAKPTGDIRPVLILRRFYQRFDNLLPLPCHNINNREVPC